MQSWSDGYVTDVTYTKSYYSDQSPVLHCLACVLAGFVPPKIHEGFTYCELGCGNGLSSALLAEAFPQGNFYAVDFNPSHIVFATQFAEDKGIPNVRFFDASFEEFIDYDLPQFDFIALHGIYSWISALQRKNVVRFINKKLKVGGVVYLSYNAMPGKMTMEPLRRVFKEIADGQSDSLRQVEEGLKLLDTMAQNPIGVFRSVAGIKETIERLKQQPREYLAHEFLHDTWTNFYCTDIFNEMSEAKLTYVGSTTMNMNFDAMSVPQIYMKTYQSLPTLNQKQLFRDLIINTAFRKDVFVRGPLRISVGQQRDIWKNIFLSRTPFHRVFQKKYICPAGEANMEKDADIPKIYDRLSENILSLADLFSGIDGIPAQKVMECVKHLLSSGQITVFSAPESETDEMTQYNKKSLDAAVNEFQGCWLASRVYGNSIALPFLQTLMIKIWLETENPEQCPEQAAAIVVQRGGTITVNNRQIKEKNELTEYFRQQYKEWMPSALNEFRRLGICRR